MIKTKIIKCGYTTRGALVMLLHTDPNLDLQDVEDVYYPYVRLRYLINVGKGKKIDKLNKFSDCIIDRVSGSTYETKGEPEYEDVEIPEEEALDIQIPMNECYDTGHSFTLKQYIGKGKLMFTPQMQIVEEDVFYKKFYVVKCLDESAQEYYILVDAVDGGISILDHEKHYNNIEGSEQQKLEQKDIE